MKDRNQFVSDLSALINRYSIDNDLKVPDFMLAEQLTKTLESLGILFYQLKKYNHEIIDQIPNEKSSGQIQGSAEEHL